MKYERTHGGNLEKLARETGLAVENIIDFSASINPLGFPEQVRSLVSRNLETLVRYPDPYSGRLRKAAAVKHGVSPDMVVPGNGSSELLFQIARMAPARRAVIPVPAYGDYSAAARSAELEVKYAAARREDGFRYAPAAVSAELDKGPALVYIGQPANPVGILMPRDDITRLATSYGDSLFCIDEAFADFVPEYRSLADSRLDNIIVLRSVTKFYALPGLRIGYAVGSKNRMENLKKFLPTWSVNSLSEVVGSEVLMDEEYQTRTLELIQREREFLKSALSAITDFIIYLSQVNYLLIEIRGDSPIGGATQLSAALLKKGIAIRTCGDFPGLTDRYFRIAVKNRQQNEALVDAVSEIYSRNKAGKFQNTEAIHTRQKSPGWKKGKKPALMIQGTTSNAGKSIMAAAFCRILLQDGYRVAPFKAQNMSLNSFVTADGGEMGRAQVVQAQACRQRPDVRMNPILLKPSSDTGSQVIVKGKVTESLKAVDYYRRKVLLFDTVKECYDSLSLENDIMVLEGAGSPAEVNLKAHDIVNMRMAAYAESPVLLTGDIDRGGVFAAFIGTMEVLSQSERELVAGFLINKFRGDETLLDPALEYVRRFTGREVMGTVPWIPDLGIPEEDSVSFKEMIHAKTTLLKDSVSIALVDLPHISNFTDIDALKLEPDTEVRIVRKVSELDDEPDVLIIPGSKNVIEDMRKLKSSGLADRISSLAQTGKTEVVGICGGFQMLGENIRDPDGIESITPDISGLGLLPMETNLEPEKVLSLTEAVSVDHDVPLKGYEIHHGATAASLPPAIKTVDGRPLGYKHPNLPVWGTYLHGLFDANEFRRRFLDRVRRRKELSPLVSIQASYDIEADLDRLAETVRRHVRMDRIYRLLGIG